MRLDLASVAYEALCTTSANTEGVEKVIIVTHLSDAWDIKNNAKKVTWEEQVRQDNIDVVEAALTWERELQLELKEHRKDEDVGNFPGT